MTTYLTCQFASYAIMQPHGIRENHSEIQSSAVAEITPYPKIYSKVGTKTRKMAHGKILTGSLHDSQLEAREAVIAKKNVKSVPEAYQARTKKPNRKKSSTNSCTEPQGTRTVKQSGNTASGDVNRAAEIFRYVHNAMNGTCHPY